MAVLLLLVGFAINALSMLLSSRAIADVALLIAFLFSMTLASLTFWRRAWLLAICASLVGFALEVVGVRYGVPFGRYEYAELGPSVLGVPVPIVIAWGIYLYACYLASSGITSGFWRRSSLASTFMVLLDLAVDPVMVELGVWTWHTHSSGWFGIPLSNFAGWFVVSMLASVAYRILSRDAGPAETPALRYAPLAYLAAFLPLLPIAGPRSIVPALAALGVAAGLVVVHWARKNLNQS